VLTPTAVALRDRVSMANREALTVLQPPTTTPIAAVARTLTVRANDGVAAALAWPLRVAAQHQAPHVRVFFVPEGDEDAASLRDGRIDLDIGVNDLTEPELRTKLLLRESFVGIARRGHPLCQGKVSLTSFVQAAHVVASRKGKATGPLDLVLAKHRKRREVAAVVPSHFAAAFATLNSDMITVVPRLFATYLASQLPLGVFEVPLALPTINLMQVWHPRFDAEPAHQWLRQTVQALMQGARSS